MVTAFRTLLLLAILLMGAADASAQLRQSGTVSGVVVESMQGTPVPGVVVSVRGTTLATKTDEQGRYAITDVPPGDHILIFSKPGFDRATVADVRVLIGQTTQADSRVTPEFYEMDTYEVVAQLFEEQSVQLLQERQDSAAMIDALGSDFLSRVGVGNGAEAVSKVSGATIVEGKFAVIRGLNDRYVTATLNGAKIPSADPYRQTAALDLFPAQVIDQVVVAKTFTPDQPGTFTGGGIDIVTKSFPEKPFASLELEGEFNTQATFNDNYLTYAGGGLDWAGMDDGSRAMPSELQGQLVPPRLAVGPGTADPRFQETYNSQLTLDSYTKALGVTQFAPTQSAPPPNHGFKLAAGGSTHLFGGPLLGYFAGVSYKHNYSFYEDGVYRRYGGVTPDGEPELLADYQDARSLDVVNWSGMVNLGLDPLPDQHLGFTFFYNQNGTDDAEALDPGFETYTAGLYRQFKLYYTERNLTTYQMRGEHLIAPLNNLEFNWLVALTQTSQDEPDARFFNDINQGGGFSTGGNTVPDPSNPTRYYRNLDENNRNVKLDWALPFPTWTPDDGKFKFGLFDSFSQRQYMDRAFYYLIPGADNGYGGDPNQYLTEDNIGLANIRTNRNSITYSWRHYIQAYNSTATFDSQYNGELGVQAGYLMAELPVLNSVQLIGGVRYEITDLSVHSESYLASSITGLKVNDTQIDQADPLPSVGLIWRVLKDMNLRLNYSQTIGRPSFRELAAYRSYDPTINDFVEGNPELVMTSVNNYDVRWEWFPRPGDVLSVSLFYKELTDAIERGNVDVQGGIITFFNRPQAKLYGVEFEARSGLDFISSSLAPFSLGGNLALVQSEVELTDEEYGIKQQFFPDADRTRPLYDQSPYIFNADLSYINPNLGTTASLVFNVAGPRIVIAKLNAYDVYQQPAPALDFVISQQLSKHLKLKFRAKNLLNPSIERTYGENSDLLYSSFRLGLSFRLTAIYDF